MFFLLLIRLLLRLFFYNPNRRPQRLNAKEFAGMFAPMEMKPTIAPEPLPMSADMDWSMGVSP